MLERNGLLDFSPLIGMAYLCEFTTFGTPVKLSKRKLDEISSLPSSNGISRYFKEISPVKSHNIAASKNYTSIGYDKSDSDGLIAASTEGTSSKELLTWKWSAISHLSSCDERKAKRRKSTTERYPYAAFLSYLATPNQPTLEKVSENRSCEGTLPWDMDGMDFPLNTPQSCQSFSFLRDVVDTDEILKEQLGRDKKPAASVAQCARLLYTPVCAIWKDDKKHAAHIAIEPLLLLPKTDSSDSSHRHDVDELKCFASHTELASLQSLRSQQGLVSWYERFRELLEFKRLHGHYNVPQKFKVFPKLGIWVNKQRCNRLILPPNKVAALESVGFDWGKKLGESAWNSKFNALVDYKTKHGDCRVPTKWPQDKSLGRWVSMQRGHYKDFKAGRKTVITKERIKMLQEIGFDWMISSRAFSLFANNTSITNTQSNTIMNRKVKVKPPAHS